VSVCRSNREAFGVVQPAVSPSTDDAVIDPSRARVFLAAFLSTFAVLRTWLWFTPNADFDVAGYNIHHLFTGVLILCGSMLPLALGAASGRPATLLTAAAGVGFSLVLDEWVYLIVTDGSNASYLLPVSFWGALVLHLLVAGGVLLAMRRRSPAGATSADDGQ
jgi:hypothetical protein